eukprot:m.267444 g.267444  ORF g.267444 m.267444 type:complete len:297 (+) comp15640_c1_seq2:1029-1919(+)
MPNFNYSGQNPQTPCAAEPIAGMFPGDFHELISCQPPFSPSDVEYIDKLAADRCGSLLAVDDTVQQVLDHVSQLDRMQNTYVMFTSDHGYNLGNHRHMSEKFLLYDHSLRIPFVIRGPGISPNTTFDFLGSNVDLAPSFLGLAGLSPPSVTDGASFLSHVINASDTSVPGSVKRHLQTTPAITRDTHFVEYYDQGPYGGSTVPKDDWSNTYIGIYWESVEYGQLKYAEYDPFGKQTGFANINTYELFNVTVDPFELYNIYPNVSQALRQQLHQRLRQATVSASIQSTMHACTVHAK